jgi:hypothetical protein
VNSTGRAWGGVLVVLLGEVALISILHWSASSDYAVPLGSLGEWLQTTDPTTALVALARVAALAIGYWLLVTTVLYALAHHLGWHSMAEILRWFTLPVVRHVVQGVTAMSLTGASLMGPAAVSVGPALAQDDTVVTQSEDDGTSSTETSTDDAYQPDAAGWPDTEIDSDFWRPTGNEVTPIQADASTHLVVAGDHLWGIAAQHLRVNVGRPVTEDEIREYWVKVMDANRDVIRSGDPDLIFPDERITLPQIYSS